MESMKISSLTIRMHARTAEQAADDLEAIAKAVRAGDIATVPASLMFGPRACGIELIRKD